jgi:hypothetical protein
VLALVRQRHFHIGAVQALQQAVTIDAGAIWTSVPIGYVWPREIDLGFDPDLRIQEVVRLIFARFRQLSSARQAFLSGRLVDITGEAVSKLTSARPCSVPLADLSDLAPARLIAMIEFV